MTDAMKLADELWDCVPELFNPADSVPVPVRLIGQIEDALRAQARCQWVKCSERLPEGNEYVLAITERGTFTVKPVIVLRNSMAAAKREGDVGYYTHWMPLPAAPKSGEG